MKKICYLLLIISYFLLGFILIYFNLINPSYEGSLGLILSIIVITIWLVAGFIILTNKNPVIKKDKIEAELNMSYIPASLSLSRIPSTNMFTVKATASNPEDAYKVILAFNDNYATFSRILLEDATLTLIEEAEIATSKVS